jgi:hypothetical protein
MEIIPARPGKGSKPDGVTVWTKAEGDKRSSAHHAIRTFAELDAEIESPRQFGRAAGSRWLRTQAAASWRGGDGSDETQ